MSGKLERGLLAALLCLGCTGCGGQGWGSSVLGFVLENNFTDLLFALIVQATIGGFVGLILAFPLYWLLRRLRFFELDWRHARWIRVLVVIALFLGTIFTAGSVGFLEGANSGIGTVVRDGQLGTEVLPLVGRLGAEALYELDCYRRDDPEAPPYADSLSIGLIAMIECVDVELIHPVMESVKVQLFRVDPELRGGLVEMLVDEVLSYAVHRIVVSQALKGFDLIGVKHQVQHCATSMLAAAESAGGNLTGEEVALQFSQELLVPVLLKPVRAFTRSQQWTVSLTLLAAILGVQLLFFITNLIIRHVRKQRARAAAQAVVGDAAAPEAVPPAPQDPT